LPASTARGQQPQLQHPADPAILPSHVHVQACGQILGYVHTNRPHRFPCGVLSLSPRYMSGLLSAAWRFTEYDHVGHEFICTNTQPPAFSPTNNSSSPMNNNKAPGPTTYPGSVSLALTFFWTAITRCFMICMSRRSCFS